MEINAGVIFQAVMCGVVLVVLLSVLLEKQRPEQPLRGRRVMVAEVEPEEPAEDPAYKELKHWTAQGLNKFGYSKDEARRMAESVPPGLDLQHALQYCLRNKGSKQ